MRGESSAKSQRRNELHHTMDGSSFCTVWSGYKWLQRRCELKFACAHHHHWDAYERELLRNGFTHRRIYYCSGGFHTLV